MMFKWIISFFRPAKIPFLGTAKQKQLVLFKGEYPPKGFKWEWDYITGDFYRWEVATDSVPKTHQHLLGLSVHKDSSLKPIEQLSGYYPPPKDKEKWRWDLEKSEWYKMYKSHTYNSAGEWFDKWGRVVDIRILAEKENPMRVTDGKLRYSDGSYCGGDCKDVGMCRCGTLAHAGDSCCCCGRG